MSKNLIRISFHLGVALIFLSGCLASEREVAKRPEKPLPVLSKRNQFVIAGSVSDLDGLPVPSLPVRVLSSVHPVVTDPRVVPAELGLLAEGETASDGSYRLVVPYLPGENRYYISFFDAKGFDSVRYARPDRIDITNRVGPGAKVFYDFRLLFHGGWEKVKETLKAYPPNSPKARIIRKYGIPEEVRKENNDSANEVWWYYSQGKSFEFQGQDLAKENSFMPVLK